MFVSFFVVVIIIEGCDVTVFDLRQTFINEDITFITGDITDAAQVTRALQNMDLVIHVASPHASCKNPSLLEKVNITGTQNIIDACVANGVTKLVFTSSGSVVSDGKAHEHVDETYPVPAEHGDVYAATKAEAERRVLAADGTPCTNGSKSKRKAVLRTVSVRPRGIFGPGDVQFFPVLVENAKLGKTKYIIGDGENLADFTFVDNVVHGHLLAAEHIDEVGGEAFFITNDEPIKFWTFTGDILSGFGYSRPWLKLPYGLILGIAKILFTINPKSTSTFTPATVEIVGNHHYFDVSKAKERLQYTPLFNMDEAVKVSLLSFPQLYREDALEAFNLERPKRRLTTWEVQQHVSTNDVWMIVDGKVHDMTTFVDMHPGGEEAFMKVAGRDASEAVRLPHHPESVWDTLNAMYLGPLEEEEEEGSEGEEKKN